MNYTLKNEANIFKIYRCVNQILPKTYSGLFVQKLTKYDGKGAYSQF